MTVIISFHDKESNDTFKGWRVDYNDKYADGLGYDEMLGLVAAITMPETRPAICWLKTYQEQKEFRRYKNNSVFVDYGVTDKHTCRFNGACFGEICIANETCLKKDSELTAEDNQRIEEFNQDIK